jgi:MFS family permease
VTDTEPPYPRRSHAWQAVGVLAIATVFSYLDRQLLYILVDPIRQTLGFTDTQLGLLQGMAFIVFYALFGLPIGRLVDRRNRRNIVIGGIVLWSGMTILCGVADDFWTLFAARAGVGVGEACLAPAAYSLISDYFPQRLRGRAMACVVLAAPIGSGSSFLLGSLVLSLVPGASQVDLPLVGPSFGWQIAFFAAGLPGLLIALLLFTIREAPRRETVPALPDLEGVVAVPATLWSFVRRNGALLACFLGAAAMFAVTAYAVSAWMSTYYLRHFGLPVGWVGVAIGILSIVAGTVGGLTGGWLSDFFSSRPWRGGRYNVICLATLACVPFLVLWVAVGSVPLSIGLLLATHLIMNVVSVGIPSAMQEIVPNQFRGQIIAFLYLINGIFGVGVGSVSIALATDYLFVESGVRMSLLVLPPITMTLAFGLAMLGWRGYQRARMDMAG